MKLIPLINYSYFLPFPSPFPSPSSLSFPSLLPSHLSLPAFLLLVSLLNSLLAASFYSTPPFLSLLPLISFSLPLSPSSFSLSSLLSPYFPPPVCVNRFLFPVRFFLFLSFLSLSFVVAGVCSYPFLLLYLVFIIIKIFLLFNTYIYFLLFTFTLLLLFLLIALF